MNKEEDPNLIELLKQALLFYANESNYYNPSNSKALIIIDNGSQARFALNKLKETTEALDKINIDYDKYMSNTIKSEESPENVLKIIEDLKNIGNGD